MIMSKAFLNIDLDFIVKNLRKRLAHSRVVELDEPNINLVALGLDDIDISLSLQEVIHSAHDNRKH